LAKSARGAGAANLISQAVSAPGVYVFNELLQINSIKEVSD
jgi:COP9 signalosome complex subunit 7